MTADEGVLVNYSSQQRMTYGLAEVATMLGCSYSSVYRWAQQGEIPTVRLGRRVFVPREALEEMLAPETD